MTEFKPEDLVRATRIPEPGSGAIYDGTVVIGYVEREDHTNLHLRPAWGGSVTIYTPFYDVELVKPAPKPIPTEDGVYLDRTGDKWGIIGDRTYFLESSRGYPGLPDRYAPYERIDAMIQEEQK